MDENEKPSILLVWESVGYDLPVTVRAGWSKVRCPLHDDSNPSASISAELNRWTCHPCGISEDSLDILMRERGISLAEARRAAEAEFGVNAAIRAVPRTSSRVARKSLWDQ